MEIIGGAVVLGAVLWVLTTIWQACAMSRSDSPLREQLRKMAEIYEDKK